MQGGGEFMVLWGMVAAAVGAIATGILLRFCGSEKIRG